MPSSICSLSECASKATSKLWKEMKTRSEMKPNNLEPPTQTGQHKWPYSIEMVSNVEAEHFKLRPARALVYVMHVKSVCREAEAARADAERELAGLRAEHEESKKWHEAELERSQRKQATPAERSEARVRELEASLLSERAENEKKLEAAIADAKKTVSTAAQEKIAGVKSESDESVRKAEAARADAERELAGLQAEHEGSACPTTLRSMENVWKIAYSTAFEDYKQKQGKFLPVFAVLLDHNCSDAEVTAASRALSEGVEPTFAPSFRGVRRLSSLSSPNAMLEFVNEVAREAECCEKSTDCSTALSKSSSRSIKFHVKPDQPVVVSKKCCKT